MASILPVLLLGSVYANLEAYVAPPRYSRRHMRFRPTISKLVPTLSPREVSAMCTTGPSTIQGFVSNACRCTAPMVHKTYLKCVISVIAPPYSPPLRKLSGLLPRGRDMETLDAPKHPTPPGCHYYSPPAHFELDARWGPAGVHQKESQCGSTWARKATSYCGYYALTSSPVIRPRRRPLLPPLL